MAIPRPYSSAGFNGVEESEGGFREGGRGGGVCPYDRLGAEPKVSFYELCCLRLRAGILPAPSTINISVVFCPQVVVALGKKLTNQSICQSGNQPINTSVSPATNQSIYQSGNQLINPSVRQSILWYPSPFLRK